MISLLGNIFQIRSLCDVEYRKLNFSAYPVHVRYLKNYAFKPIVIAVSKELPVDVANDLSAHRE